MVGVQNFKFSGYMTVSGLCMHDFGKFWKILDNFLLFTEIPTEKMLQRQIYVQNIQYDVLLRKGGGGGSQVLRHFDDGVGASILPPPWMLSIAARPAAQQLAKRRAATRAAAAQAVVRGGLLPGSTHSLPSHTQCHHAKATGSLPSGAQRTGSHWEAWRRGDSCLSGKNVIIYDK